jgi:hypothetical protein
MYLHSKNEQLPDHDISLDEGLRIMPRLLRDKTDGYCFYSRCGAAGVRRRIASFYTRQAKSALIHIGYPTFREHCKARINFPQ